MKKICLILFLSLSLHANDGQEKLLGNGEANLLGNGEANLLGKGQNKNDSKARNYVDRAKTKSTQTKSSKKPLTNDYSIMPLSNQYKSYKDYKTALQKYIYGVSQRIQERAKIKAFFSKASTGILGYMLPGSMSPPTNGDQSNLRASADLHNFQTLLNQSQNDYNQTIKQSNQVSLFNGDPSSGYLLQPILPLLLRSVAEDSGSVSTGSGSNTNTGNTGKGNGGSGGSELAKSTTDALGGLSGGANGLSTMIDSCSDNPTLGKLALGPKTCSNEKATLQTETTTACSSTPPSPNCPQFQQKLAKKNKNCLKCTMSYLGSLAGLGKIAKSLMNMGGQDKKDAASLGAADNALGATDKAINQMDQSARPGIDSAITSSSRDGISSQVASPDTAAAINSLAKTYGTSPSNIANAIKGKDNKALDEIMANKGFENFLSSHSADENTANGLKSLASRYGNSASTAGAGLGTLSNGAATLRGLSKEIQNSLANEEANFDRLVASMAPASTGGGGGSSGSESGGGTFDVNVNAGGPELDNPIDAANFENKKDLNNVEAETFDRAPSNGNELSDPRSLFERVTSRIRTIFRN